MKKFLPLWVFSCLISAAHAELPLTIEDLITDKSKFKLDVGLTYANADQRGLTVDEPVTVPTGPASFVTLPSRIGETGTNRDSWVGTLGLRYGVTAKIEAYARMSYISTTQRTGPLKQLDLFRCLVGHQYSVQKRRHFPSAARVCGGGPERKTPRLGSVF
jgi:hypothetical protein